jgi:tetratricopeptide (TPR) repeat protein
MGLIKPEHHDAFISYASRDNVAYGELVRGVRDDLATKFTARFASEANALAEFFIDQTGFFIDQTGMPANGLPSEELKREVILAEYLVIFMSERYLQSEFCGKELDWFKERFGGDRSAALQRTFIIVLERGSLTRNWKSFLEKPERPKFVELFDEEGEPLRRYLQASRHRAVLNPVYEEKLDWIVRTMLAREQKKTEDPAPVRGDQHRDETTAALDPRAPGPIVHPEIRETPSFTDRESELASLHELLWAGHTAAVTQPVAAHGLGGIGKSALAREYALRNQGDYAGVWWLNAAKPVDGSPGFEGVEQALIELAAIFNGGIDQTQERAKAARQTLELIADGRFDKPWLLVYDNVDDTRVLREWAPRGNAHVLVTTRLSGFPRQVKTVDIDEWALPDAIRYLRDESGRSDLTEDDAKDIAEALGRLPLALSHAAALLRDNVTITSASYIALLSQHMSEAPEGSESGRAVFATFKEALVAAERRAPGAGAVMSIAGFFAPDDIPEELFRQPPECYPPVLAELVNTPGRMDRAIGALAHLSLVDFHPDKRTFSVHRLVQAAARDALGDAALAWSSSALRAVVSAFPVPEFKTWPLCERLVPHVRAVAAQMTEDSGELAWLLTSTGDYLGEQAAINEVLPLYERAQTILKRLAQADPGSTYVHRELSVAHNKIGDVQRAQGNLDAALKAYRDSHAIFKKLAAQDAGNAGWQHDLSVSFDRMGAVQSARGDLDAALKAYQDGLALREKLVAQDPSNSEWQRDLSVSFNLIGDVQLARGKLDAALEAYEADLAIAEKLTAQDPSNSGWQRDLSVSFDKIGNVQSARGDLDAGSKFIGTV